jgi:Fe-Mn family superoxide dismutase
MKFEGGGHFNHEFFWDNLAPISNGGGLLPGEESELHKWIVKDFGSIENFEKEFYENYCAMEGWKWLILNKDKNKLEFWTTDR